MIICRSDALAMVIDLKSATLRASKEREMLELGREKLERERERLEQEREGLEWERDGLERERENLESERERMRRERELWEKAREDRVPQGAFWEDVSPAVNCRGYGKREYLGIIRDIPKGWTAIDACMNMPVEIEGVTIRRPDWCTHTLGHWIVDWDQPDCKPWYKEFHDAVSPVSSLHLYVTVMLTRLIRDVQATGLVPVGSRLTL